MVDINECPRSAVVDAEKGLVDEKNVVIERSDDSGTAAPFLIDENVSSGLKHGGSQSLGKNLLSRAISRVLSLPFKKSHLEPAVNDLPPDGGLRAWAIVFFAHQTGFNTFGFLNSYGVLQNHYVAALDLPPSTVSCKTYFQTSLIPNKPRPSRFL